MQHNHKAFYRPFGPFKIPTEVPKRGGRQLNLRSIKRSGDFWTSLEDAKHGLSTAKGCYIFSMKAGKGVTPWYVGKAGGREGFRQEIFIASNRDHYTRTLNDKKGTPLLLVLARCTPKKKFSNQTHPSDLVLVEKMLIGLALRKNPKLHNIKEADFHRSSD
jgi:hypothetical protein